MKSKQIIMTSPVNFGISYEINQWMKGNIGSVDIMKAVQQWNDLRNALVAVGADVIVMPPPPPDCPDAVFTANAGLIHGDNFLISRFAKIERRAEEPYFGHWFKRHAFNVISNSADVAFEGAGDALFSADRRHLWFGFGHRSEFEYKRFLDEYFDAYPETIVRPLNLVNPNFYHLDTCFCPLDTGDLLWYPGAFDEHSQMVIRSWHPNAIEVSTDDANLFACNAVSVGTNLVVPLISDELVERLTRRGLTVTQVNMSEFLKSGGAAKCLTLEVVSYK